MVKRTCKGSLGVVVACSLWGCSVEGSTEPASATRDLEASAAEEPARARDQVSESPAAPRAGSKVFDPTHVAELRLEVSAEGLAVLRADIARRMGTEDFTYVPARLTYDGVTLEQVGLRIKGNSSRGRAQGLAAPFKLDFNEYVKGQTLDGLGKVNLHNSGMQGHGMTDYLSYGAFRRAGVAASRTGWADVYINGEKIGLYTTVEQVDDDMLAHWFDEPKADLYKPEPATGFLVYAGDSVTSYPTLGYEGDEGDTDHAPFLQLVKTINQQPVSAWNSVIDVDSVLTYLAGNVALGNWDTYVAMGHNYYLFEQTPGRFVMLPWDMNLSQSANASVCAANLRMTPPGGGDFPPGGAFPRGGAAPTAGGAVGPGGAAPAGGFPPGGGFPGGFPGGGRTRSAPLYDKLMSDPGQFARYLETLETFLAGPGSVEALLADVDVAVAAVGNRVAAQQVEALRTAIRTRVSGLEAAIPGTTACPPVAGTSGAR